MIRLMRRLLKPDACDCFCCTDEAPYARDEYVLRGVEEGGSALLFTPAVVRGERLSLDWRADGAEV